MEKMLHGMCGQFAVRGEWFTFGAISVVMGEMGHKNLTAEELRLAAS